jgi:hypothetical protein
MMRRFSRLDVVVFGGILLLGLGRLPSPFTGDQALNMLMGKVIAHGGAPYLDLWDLKHPGIFFFFAAAGRLFGFSEIGIHLFELLWMLVLALAVRVTAEQFLKDRMAISLAPALTIGFYYAAATGVHLTQTEALVGLPLLLSLTSAAAAVRTSSRRRLLWLFSSGLSAGVVLVFKAPYFLLPAIFWVMASVEWRRAQGKGIMRGIMALAPPLLVGTLLPVSASVIYLAEKHALGLAWWTFVVHPREAASQTALDFQVLRDGSIWFVRTFSPLLALAIIGGWARVRQGWDLLAGALIAWIPVGLLLIWVQVIGWWSYHYLLLLVPIGLLAAQGVETLWSGVAAKKVPRRWRAAAAIVLVGLIVISIPQIEVGARSVADVFRASPLPFDIVSARPYQAEQDRAYAVALDTTSFLRAPGSDPGPIYVFGSPIVYILAGRSPAISFLATWFSPTTEAWHRMVAELTAAPPKYILVTDGALGSFTADNPALADEVRSLRSWLEQRYQVLRTDVGGVWYLRRDLAA